MKHRFDGFDREMNANASRVAVMNQLARQLLHVEHPNSEDIVARQNTLNSRLEFLYIVRAIVNAKGKVFQIKHNH